MRFQNKTFWCQITPNIRSNVSVADCCDAWWPVSGDKGDYGPQGCKGCDGAPGLKGDKGEPGLPGESGVVGQKGETSPCLTFTTFLLKQFKEPLLVENQEPHDSGTGAVLKKASFLSKLLKLPSPGWLRTYSDWDCHNQQDQLKSALTANNTTELL